MMVINIGAAATLLEQRPEKIQSHTRAVIYGTKLNMKVCVCCSSLKYQLHFYTQQMLTMCQNQHFQQCCCALLLHTFLRIMYQLPHM